MDIVIDPQSLMTFWDQFLPNVLATLIGAAIGVPIGLWINRVAASHSEQRRREADAKRVSDALASIITVLRANRSRLLELKDGYAEERVRLDTSLDTSAWDTLGPDLALGLPDPDLRRRLAYHFLRLKEFVRTNERLLDLSGLGVQSAMGDSEKIGKFLGIELKSTADALATDADVLLEEADIAHKRLQLSRTA